MSVSMITDNL